MSVWSSFHDLLVGKDSLVRKCDVQHGAKFEKLSLKENLCYIVAGIVINDANEVLMVQEAKASCYGKWYLPAGRMEPGETIVEAAKREVLEEAGLEFEPISLLCIEECGGRWVRFPLIGKIVGGKLKTTAQGDEESLQATWWDQQDDIPLRSKDILPLIKLGVERKSTETSSHILLPTIQPQILLFLRILTIHTQSNEDVSLNGLGFSVLLIEEKLPDDSGARFRAPTSRIHPDDRTFHTAIDACYQEALSIGDDVDAYSRKIAGILNVEHGGMSSDNMDGLSISLMVRISSKIGTSPPPPCRGPFKWLKMAEIQDGNAVDLIKEKLSQNSPMLLRSLKAEK